jgi:DNA repair exonuclease SbcCD nuclease subunit
MVKLVITCGDIHIRNFVRQEEFGEQLTKFIEKCIELSEPYEKDEVRIVIVGDILHQKNNISPELITLVSAFIRQLEEIAKVILIAGNHDLLENNQSRKDAISSIFDTAQFQNSFLLDKELDYRSGCVEDDNIVWAVYSIYDDYMKPDIATAKLNHPQSKIIGLYHGMIVGAALDNGQIVDNGVDGDIFGGCDCVMCGHIHKRQELKRGGVPIVYCGSLIQQTYGETTTQHGFSVWNIETMKHKFVDLETEYGLYDVEINDIADIDNDKEIIRNY